jgi:hypothetical protein
VVCAWSAALEASKSAAASAPNKRTRLAMSDPSLRKSLMSIQGASSPFGLSPPMKETFVPPKQDVYHVAL